MVTTIDRSILFVPVQSLKAAVLTLLFATYECCVHAYAPLTRSSTAYVSSLPWLWAHLCLC